MNLQDLYAISPLIILVTWATLLILVAIIGLLAAIAIPSFVKARNTSQQNACINNLRQFGVAFEMYADDWYEKFPVNEYALFGAATTKTIYPDFINTTKTETKRKTFFFLQRNTYHPSL